MGIRRIGVNKYIIRVHGNGSNNNIYEPIEINYKEAFDNVDDNTVLKSIQIGNNFTVGKLSDK